MGYLTPGLYKGSYHDRISGKGEIFQYHTVGVMIILVIDSYLARTIMTISTIRRIIPHAIADLMLENFIRLRFRFISEV
jgi:hypothetical protein